MKNHWSPVATTSSKNKKNERLRELYKKRSKYKSPIAESYILMLYYIILRARNLVYNSFSITFLDNWTTMLGETSKRNVFRQKYVKGESIGFPQSCRSILAGSATCIESISLMEIFESYALCTLDVQKRRGKRKVQRG